MKHRYDVVRERQSYPAFYQTGCFKTGSGCLGFFILINLGLYALVNYSVKSHHHSIQRIDGLKGGYSVLAYGVGGGAGLMSGTGRVHVSMLAPGDDDEIPIFEAVSEHIKITKISPTSVKIIYGLDRNGEVEEQLETLNGITFEYSKDWKEEYHLPQSDTTAKTVAP